MTDTYLRSPHLSGDRVVFVADDDVWSVSADGGTALRLTADRVPVARPRLSPDGSLVAWTSRREGEPEVFVAPTAGGSPQRLTWWGSAQTRLLGWAADGRVLAATPAGSPFRTHSWAYALPVNGDPVEQLPYGPIGGLALSPSGPTVLQSVILREAASWKRYRGGTAGKLWIEAASGSFSRFLGELAGQLVDPVWLGDRLVFLSDHEGHGNVYSVAADGSGLHRHSDHTGAYARDLVGDLTGAGTRAVYARSGELWLLADLAADSTPVQLAVDLPGARAARQRTRVEAKLEHLELAVDLEGRGSVIGARGTVQWLPHRDGPVRVLSAADGVRARTPRVVPTAPRTAVWVTDAEGDDALEIGDGTTSRVLAAGAIGRVLELVVAPDGKSAAVATHDGRVLRVDLAKGRVTEVAQEVGDASGLSFSPDSALLAWSAPSPSGLRQIRLAELGSGTVVDATPLRFVDTEPVFTLDGKHLAFLSARTFDPVYDAQAFELSFPVAVRPYLLPLRAGAPSPFDPELEGRAVTPPEAGEAATGFDAEGLADRVVPVPGAAGLYSWLRAAEGGLLWLAHPLAGVLGQDRPATDRRRPSLRRWDFGTRRELTIVPELDGYAVSGDGKRIAVRDGEALRIGPSDRPVKPSEQPEAAPTDLVEVDLGRVRVNPDPVAEWRQMTTETWRLMRDHFWIEDMGGVDWDEVLTRYLPVVDRLATRDDLSELLWEMIGELGASHCYERPPVVPPTPGGAAAFLGADLERVEDGWRVASVLPADTSVPAARSPLSAPSVDVQAGDVLVAIDGQPIPASGVGPLLAGRADVPVELTVRRGKGERIVVVVPLADEFPVRYQQWVAGRRREVHSRTDGRVGYVHIPDMMSTGWAEFHRDLRAELERDALVVDTRENGGGHVSQLVLERLSRKPIGGDVVRHGPEESWPGQAAKGPMVSLANEYAGSDGDIVNQSFKEMGLGPVVGVRTWGGVIGIDGRYSLVDGSWVTQPRYSFWFRGAGWSVENYGVDPDLEVPMPPQAWTAGEDPQLDEGLRVVTEALASYPPLTRPPLESRPDRSIPPLPTRP